jgi:DNA-binding CsgD family transcriptional regulator
MLENYTNEEIAQILDIGPTRVEWFMRKIEGWKRK